MLCIDLPLLTQGVHLQLLPQSDLLQAVVEVGLRVASGGGREGEDPHDLPLVPATQLVLKDLCNACVFVYFSYRNV